MEPTQDVNPASRESHKAYEAAPVLRTEHVEGGFTRLIEQQAARVPSDFFLFVSFSAMLASLVAEITGRRRFSRFVGMWPAPLLVMGVYNKLVKTFGPR